MQYVKLGRTGLRVSRLSLGTLTFGLQVDEQGSHAILDRAFAAGINCVDTGDVYNEGKSEEYIGSWLPGKRDRVIVATKVRGTTGPGPNDVGLSRAHIMQGVEASLRRLRTDYVDLFQIHAPDPDTPIEETLRALDDLVHQGKVLYLGCSNHQAWQLCKALWTSDVHGLARFDSVQPRYNLLDRAIEEELLPLCVSEGVGVICYNPSAGGFLSGKYQRGQPPTKGTRFDVKAELYQQRYWHEANFDIVDRLWPLAKQGGRSLVQLALAWVLANPAVSSAIVGATTTAQLDENLGALERPLSEEEKAVGEKAAEGSVIGKILGLR